MGNCQNGAYCGNGEINCENVDRAEVLIRPLDREEIKELAKSQMLYLSSEVEIQDPLLRSEMLKESIFPNGKRISDHLNLVINIQRKMKKWLAICAVKRRASEI